MLRSEPGRAAATTVEPPRALAPPTTTTTGRRLAGGVVLAGVGGVALVLACPSVGVWPLVFVAFAPIAVAQNRVLPARWSGLALAVGVGGFLAVVLPGVLLPSQRWWLVPIVLALAATGRVSRLWHDATGRRHLWWADPVSWTAALFLLGTTPLASWIDPAYDLYRQPWLIQPVSIVAVSGLNLTVMLVSYAVAGLWLAPRQRRSKVTAGAAALLVVWSVASVALLGAGDSGREIRVAVVQPGLRHLETTADPVEQRANLDVALGRLEASTRRAAAGGADLVVWPEATLRYVDPRLDLAARLGRLVQETGVHLVIGYTPDPAHFNRATVLEPGGRFLVVYDKQHPITFQGDHSTGGPVRVADTARGAVAPIICYDLDFGDTARSAARQGAELLAVPSEDWSGIARQHYAHLVFRAVENHLAAAKADTAWDSAIIDPHGRLLATHVSTRGDAAVLSAVVPLGTGDSAYVAVGDVVGWLSVGFAALWMGGATAAVLRRRRLNARSAP